MTTDTKVTFLLNVDEMYAASRVVGVQDLPRVLALRPNHTTVERRDRALADATQALRARGVITDGNVRTDLMELLLTAQRPDRELALRWVTPSGVTRISLACKGVSGVLIRRAEAQFAIYGVGTVPTARAAAIRLLAELPAARPADIEPVGGPLTEMSECLSGSHDLAELTDGVRATGATPRAAAVMGAALSRRRAFAEIVYRELLHERAVIGGPSVAVGVFYTERGRIIAVPSMSQAGQLWTTLKAGSDQVFGQAVEQLVEMSEQGWEVV